jgi:hypothetical protein
VNTVFGLGMSSCWLMSQVMDCSQCVNYWQLQEKESPALCTHR